MIAPFSAGGKAAGSVVRRIREAASSPVLAGPPISVAAFGAGRALA
jgi:hypothetical protein